MTIRYYGIRHHGPGSTRNLLAALQQFEPEVILLEAPAELEPVLSWVVHKKMMPPVALLVYNPKDLGQAAFLPFASFSPEWQAMIYALRREIPLVPMDLPISQLLGLKTPEGSEELFPEDRPGSDELRRDPLGVLAGLAGYADRENWWEVTFERLEQPESIFEAIAEMMEALREDEPEADRETRLREACMRKALRGALKKGYDRLAVVCGAWHVPALRRWDRIPAKTDNAALRGLKKVRTKATWIPWAYDRLARASGYGAGVRSPAWYELLYRERAQSQVHWMSRAARLLRSEDLPASAAEAVEAARLADTLSALRGHPQAGLAELLEAARSVFTMGAEAPLQLIHEQLVVGERVGRVPPDQPSLPLQQDFEKQVRSARLSKEYRTTVALTKVLDLRKNSNRLASILLHRLRLLDLPWGELRSASEEQKGSFKENWRLKWKAEYTIRLIEAARWGNTFEEACSAYVRHRIEEADRLSGLTDLLEQVLPAGLPGVLPHLLQAMEDRAARSQNIEEMAGAVPALVRLWRYGDARGTPVDTVKRVLQHLLPRILLGLPRLLTQVEEAYARKLFDIVVELNHSLFLLAWEETEKDWLATLAKLSGRPGIHPLLLGLCNRLLLDRNYLSGQAAGKRLARALSQDEGAADWLEGFLYGSGLLLLHQPSLWAVIDEWVAGLKTERFQELLPALRRSFSRFSSAERQKMLRQVGSKDPADRTSSLQLDPDRLALILPSLRDRLQ